MRQFFDELKDFFKKGDMVLLILCLITSGFGVVIIASATSAEKFGSNVRYIVVQLLAILIGVTIYALFSSIDMEFLQENRNLMVAFNCFLLLLLIPFGTDNNTGNRSWLDFPFLPFFIQPAEICKITYVIIMASVMSSHQNRISSIPSVMHMVFHLALLVGLNMVLSSDMGVSLIFVFIFIGMTFAGGVSLWWFALAIGGIAAALPILWQFLGEYQRQRILILIDPSFDAQGTGARYHSKINLQSLTGGGLTGQGLFQGNRTQALGALYAQHTDYIFSAIGEELGYSGCVFTVLLLVAIIARYMRRLICFGVASALIFQVISNVGMCIGLTPVIGLTLPFISYGGSSLISMFAMMGLVSGVFARPAPTSHERYIRPPYSSY